MYAQTLSYRLLNNSDLLSLLDLHERVDNFMGTKMDQEEKQNYLKRIEWLFSQSDYKTVGAFDEDRLVAALGGRFFEGFPYWYCHGQVHKLPINSLAAARNYFVVIHRLTRLLLEYGEEHGYYGFYIAKEARDWIASWKIREKMLEKEEFDYKRYDYYLDQVYLPGDQCKNKTHDFFFRPVNTIKVPTMVYLGLLKNQYREVIFEEKIKIGTQT